MDSSTEAIIAAIGVEIGKLVIKFLKNKTQEEDYNEQQNLEKRKE